ncbi:hypothetical protein [Kutzneria sp. 744]|uniref:hypothetical protein n=1 Tax=Kutzneria sp. (strain 744) TaxID=345341 RepID=UPI0018DB51D6|nr:hypothetical protein [Kutzneria sp. 744]
MTPANGPMELAANMTGQVNRLLGAERLRAVGGRPACLPHDLRQPGRNRDLAIFRRSLAIQELSALNTGQ